MNVLIAEDQSITALGLEMMLKKSGFDVFIVEDGESLFDLAVSNSFELLIVDYAIPKLNGLEALIEIKKQKPDQKSIVISSMKSEMIHSICLENHIEGYIFKSESKTNLMKAIEKVLKGGKFYSTEKKEDSLTLWNHPDNPFLKLTDKEILILKEMLQFKSMKNTSEKFNLAIKTVDTHRNNIKRKLKMDSEEIAKEAKIWGLL